MKPYYRYFIAGKTQRGKSTWIKKHLASFSNYVVIDSVKNEYGPEYGTPAASAADVVRLLRSGVRKIIWKAPPSVVSRELDALVRFLFNHVTNFLLVIDEIQLYCSKHSIGAALRDYVAAGEGEPRRLGLMVSSQRPQNVHNDFISQSTVRVSFQLDHDRDDELMAGYMRLKKGRLMDTTGHDFYVYDGETGETVFYEN